MFLSPNYINSHPCSSIGKFEHVLTLMLEKNFLKGNKYVDYNVLTDRLDDFLFSVIGRKDEYF